VNAVTPTALRFEPSLLVTDAEIDEGVAVLARVLADGVGAASTEASPS
jgi:acetylornithine/succinyldiaminopimelate/putrescine aminotransferase